MLSRNCNAFLAYSPGLHPASYKELHSQLLNESTQEHLFQYSYSYFNNYILKGGLREHPVLGDLRYFAYQIEACWNQQNPTELGNNPIVQLLNSSFSLGSDNDLFYVNALRNALVSPAKEGLIHFREYFQKNGTQKEHPILGDLLVFASNIQKHWDPYKGENLIADFLRSRLDSEIRQFQPPF